MQAVRAEGNDGDGSAALIHFPHASSSSDVILRALYALRSASLMRHNSTPSLLLMCNFIPLKGEMAFHQLNDPFLSELKEELPADHYSGRGRG